MSKSKELKPVVTNFHNGIKPRPLTYEELCDLELRITRIEMRLTAVDIALYEIKSETGEINRKMDALLTLLK